jgi:hypothetical protein
LLKKRSSKQLIRKNMKYVIYYVKQKVTTQDDSDII